MEYDPKEKLSDHFTLGECCKSETAMRLGIDNEPNEIEYYNLKKVCMQILEPVRVYFDKPFIPNSGFRCQELNKAIGSSTTSQHAKGQAIDFELPGIDNLEVASWLRENVSFDQLILEHYDGVDPNSGWIHVSYVSPEDNRRQALTYDGKNYEVWA